MRPFIDRGGGIPVKLGSRPYSAWNCPVDPVIYGDRQYGNAVLTAATFRLLLASVAISSIACGAWKRWQPGRGEAETESIRAASQDFRQRTMEVLRLAFLSSGVLIEFFTSLSIALVAVYFGFSYLGELDFGHYGTGVTLAAGFLALILAPEFSNPCAIWARFITPKHKPLVQQTV